MHLIPREIDKLLLAQAGFLAQRRLARGVKLNHAEATALISNVLHELIRDGRHSVSDLMTIGAKILGTRNVDSTVISTIAGLQVEGTFPTGTHLVTVDHPISTKDGNLELAMYGSCLTPPPPELFPSDDLLEDGNGVESRPGAIVCAQSGGIKLREGRPRRILRVVNQGDRAIQIGSHFHFIEANPYLEFDRLKAYGYHLDIPAGTSVRFEPGEAKTVSLSEIGGLKTIRGGSSIAPGRIDLSRADDILRRIEEQGFYHTPETTKAAEQPPEPYELDRRTYSSMYGPTVGDCVRLSSTDLWIKVEEDLTTKGDECTFGGGKTLRDGVGQASGRSNAQCLDLVITNALIVDWSGIMKADIGIKGGCIVGIGKAGNPDTMDRVNPAMIVGSGTDVIAGEGKIITAGAIDTHCHFICPQQADEALAAGITTQFSGGTGPSTATIAANCTPGQDSIRRMMQACDRLPLNYGLLGKGSDTGIPGLRDQIQAGVAGLKVHEDWGCTPSSISNCLSLCDEYDVQCELHSDSLNEAGFVEQTAAAFKGRTIHAYHIEGAGGGHAPDLIRLVENSNVLPSSTNPTCPYTTDTVEEHLDMAMSCHHLSKDIPEDISFAESRIRPETIAAEDVLHDMGAISMMSSDSQAMGRCGETVLRTWNMAHANKVHRGQLEEDKGTGADNHRVKRYISKYTINPAITQGISHVVGSVEVGRLADLVLWEPSRFGTKPFQVLKSGQVACAQMGDPNASYYCPYICPYALVANGVRIATVQPVIMRPMFSPLVPSNSITFTSAAAIANGLIDSYGLEKRVEAVKDTRSVGKHDMKYNGATPKMKVDPETFAVVANGIACNAPPMTCLPLAQAFYLN